MTKSTSGALEVKGLSKRFGDVLAVDSMNLEIRPGELLALLGPSGCGKTTVLRLIAGLEIPENGMICFNGNDWSSVPPQERNVAMVFQYYGLYPNRTVRGNIEYPLRLKRISPEERQAKIKWISDFLGIFGLLDRKPRDLSGGEAQRVALARALVREPTCFLMDEPLSNLDAQLRLRARAEIKRVQRGLKVTAIYVTHDQEEAVAVADRIAVMNKGRLVQVGTADALFHNPDTVFVAQFLGRPPMNVLSAKVVGEEVGFPLLALQSRDGTSQSAGLKVNARIPVGTTVFVGIRPDRVLMEDGHPLPTSLPAWNISGETILVEGLAPDHTVHVETAFGQILVRPRKRPSGRSVALALPLRESYLFEPESGSRIRLVEAAGADIEEAKCAQ